MPYPGSPHSYLASAILGNSERDTEAAATRTTATPDTEQFTIARLTGGVEVSRPLAQKWNGVLGLSWARVGCLDSR